MQHKGNLFVVSAASGTGKSSLVKALMQTDSNIKASVSHTTRGARGKEQNGVEYNFIKLAEFQQMIAQQQFLEWAKVHDNYYGTSKQAVQDMLNQGIDVVLEIDVQGALQIKKIFSSAILIFILPPSWQELQARLIKRNEDSSEIIATRLNNATNELIYTKDFNFVIINDVFEVALSELQSIVCSQRLTIAYQSTKNNELFKTFKIPV